MIILFVKNMFILLILLIEYPFSSIITLYLRKKSAKILHEHNSEQTTKQTQSIFKSFINGVLNYEIRLASNININSFRVFLYKKMFHMQIGRFASIYPNVLILCPWKINIGENVIIGSNTVLDGRNGIFIGDNVNISSHVSIWTMQHDANDNDFKCVGGPVNICNRVWLSSGCVVLPNITVSEGCVISANSVVTKNTVPFGIYCGYAATFKKKRNEDINYCFKGEHTWFL